LGVEGEEVVVEIQEKAIGLAEFCKKESHSDGY